MGTIRQKHEVKLLLNDVGHRFKLSWFPLSNFGKVAEWLKAADCKSVEGSST